MRPKGQAQWRQLLGVERQAIATAETDPWVRDHAAAIVASLPASGEHLRALTRQVGLDLPL